MCAMGLFSLFLSFSLFFFVFFVHVLITKFVSFLFWIFSKFNSSISTQKKWESRENSTYDAIYEKWHEHFIDPHSFHTSMISVWFVNANNSENRSNNSQNRTVSMNDIFHFRITLPTESTPTTNAFACLRFANGHDSWRGIKQQQQQHKSHILFRFHSNDAILNGEYKFQSEYEKNGCIARCYM